MSCPLPPSPVAETTLHIDQSFVFGDAYEQRNDIEKATNAYQEGLAITERLAKMLPDIPAFTEGLSFFVKKLDNLH